MINVEKLMGVIARAAEENKRQNDYDFTVEVSHYGVEFSVWDLNSHKFLYRRKYWFRDKGGARYAEMLRQIEKYSK